MKHRCKEMERADEMLTINGRRAYAHYSHWMETQNRKIPVMETFMISSYYTSFIKFSQWAYDMSIPNVKKYIDVMVKGKIAPALWRRDEAYSIFLEWFDKISSPLDQVSDSIDTIRQLSAGLECEAQEVFQHMRVGEMLQLIQQRKLSPWLLFCSNSFKLWVAALDSDDRSLLMDTIGISAWSEVGS